MLKIVWKSFLLKNRFIVRELLKTMLNNGYFIAVRVMSYFFLPKKLSETKKKRFFFVIAL